MAPSVKQAITAGLIWHVALSCNALSGEMSGFYSAQQAEQGAEVFRQHCAQCHTLDDAAQPTGLVGADFLSRWYSVAGLYHRNRWTMPADQVLGLSVEDYLAVTAFLLQKNGLQAGADALVEDEQAMKSMVLAQPLPKRTASGGTGAENGFYTLAQAARGKNYFDGSCLTCHSAQQPDKPSTQRSEQFADAGLRMGSQLWVLPLGRKPQLTHRYTVGDLFLKSSTSMPVEYPNALNRQAYLDIVAYLLQSKGYPAGNHELAADLQTMKAMLLPEEGFRPLFNGRDFTGFRFLLGNGCTPRPTGCGSTEPGTTFQAQKGMIHISGRPSGYMYTQNRYLNFTLRFDVRYVPYPGMVSDDDYYTNGGVLLFLQDHQVWPKTLEVQGLYKVALSVLPIDTPAAFEWDIHTQRTAMHPVGEWNAVEIVSNSGKITVSVNSQLVTTVSQHEFTEPGQIGFQSEGSEMFLRNLRIRPE